MFIEMFNFWYFFFLFASVGVYLGLYFLLRNRSTRTKNIVLFSILVFALLLHFLKVFIPPYSTDEARMYRDIWFINICAVNILFFPFIFLSKNKTLRDYMVQIGIASGFVATIYPVEPMMKADQMAEILDIIRFYIHHAVIWIVPLLMVTLDLHKISYKRILRMAPCLLGVFLFIMLNQLFQQELGFTPVRGSGNPDITDIGWKNTSYIWGADEGDIIGEVLDVFCPKLFKTIPVGPHAGARKHWPFFWMICPVYVYFTILSSIFCLIFDGKNFINGIVTTAKNTKSRVVGMVKSFVNTNKED